MCWTTEQMLFSCSARGQHPGRGCGQRRGSAAQVPCAARAGARAARREAQGAGHWDGWTGGSPWSRGRHPGSARRPRPGSPPKGRSWWGSTSPRRPRKPRLRSPAFTWSMSPTRPRSRASSTTSSRPTAGSTCSRPSRGSRAGARCATSRPRSGRASSPSTSPARSCCCKHALRPMVEQRAGSIITSPASRGSRGPRAGARTTRRRAASCCSPRTWRSTTGGSGCG